MPGGPIFISLPVSDVARAAVFYEAIGFTRDPAFASAHGAGLRWSDAVTLMVVDHGFYATLTPKRIIDARDASGALFAFALESRAAVDAMAAAAMAAGGREAHGAQEEGPMYSRGFEDPDGHGFGPFHMGGAAPAATQAAGPGGV